MMMIIIIIIIIIVIIIIIIIIIIYLIISSKEKENVIGEEKEVDPSTCTRTRVSGLATSLHAVMAPKVFVIFNVLDKLSL